MEYINIKVTDRLNSYIHVYIIYSLLVSYFFLLNIYIAIYIFYYQLNHFTTYLL